MWFQVIITEPVTMVTDYVLGIMGLYFAISLHRLNRERAQNSVRLWMWSFAFLSAAAFFGGTSHGFGESLSALSKALIWKCTVMSVGMAGLLMPLGTITSTLSNPARRWTSAAFILKFFAYAAWMMRHDKFLFVVCDYAPSMLAVMILQIYAARKYGAESARWLIGGVLVTFGAAAVQAAQIRLHEHFNHNDLYHVIQMSALYLFYRGSRLLRDI
mgnify:CR=1 FL=1